MLESITHKGSTLVKGNLVVTYTIQDSHRGRFESSITLPIEIATLGSRLSSLALHAAWKKNYFFHLEIDSAENQFPLILNKYYSLLAQEGYDIKAIRYNDFVFYRRAIAHLEAAQKGNDNG